MSQNDSVAYHENKKMAEMYFTIVKTENNIVSHNCQLYMAMWLELNKIKIKY